MMKKFVTVVLVTATLVGGVQMTAVAAPADKICGGWRYDLTQLDTRYVRGTRLVECVFEFLGMPEQISTAQYVARRETGNTYDPNAYNPSGCAGIFQHMLRYWRGRAIAFLPLWRFPNRTTVSAFNALANVWVTARMVKAGRWGPWQ